MCQVTKQVFSKKTHKQKDAQRASLNGGLEKGEGEWEGELEGLGEVGSGMGRGDKKKQTDIGRWGS